MFRYNGGTPPVSSCASPECLGDGVFSRVYPVAGDESKVIKASRADDDGAEFRGRYTDPDDGTGRWTYSGCERIQDGCVYWLIWSVFNQSRFGVPRIHGMQVESDGTYRVIMDRYRSGQSLPVVDGIMVERDLMVEHAPEVLDTLDEFERFTGVSPFEDLHAGNIMRGHDGGVIVTDPLAYSDIGDIPAFAMRCAEKYGSTGVEFRV